MLLLFAAFLLICSVNAVRANPRSTACGVAFNTTDVLTATLAHDCLLSVPFNATVASQFIQYYNDTLQFQSTLAYLKNPPPSYQQPAIDLLAGLATIQQQISNGVFENEYDFEAAVQRLIQSSHDGHISLFAGALNVFTFGSPVGLASVSSDGIELPEVFIAEDLVVTKANRVGWSPSAITEINGQNVTQFLLQFARTNAFGTLEPHADWNQLMVNPAADIQGLSTAFTGSSPFYPGDTIEFKFENGSHYGPSPWLAYYNVPLDLGVVNTGQDFYNFFVVGIFSDGASPTAGAMNSAAATSIYTFAAAATTLPASASSTASADPTDNLSQFGSFTSWNNPGFPDDPDVVQPNLGLMNGGFLTGYFLNATSVGVLSIPSFEVTGEAVTSFSTTIGEFLTRSKAAGLKTIVIDLQRNLGGDLLLATDAFKQFFPTIDPFGGSRLRAHPSADALGNTFTDFYNTRSMNASFYAAMSADVWTATDYLNADTGNNFTSWAEFFGPHGDNGDFFSTTQRDNLSSIVFDMISSGGIVIDGFANRTITSPTPYAAEDIILLTDGICHSTCSVFIELMHHQAGVRTVVAGGLPQSGSMQTPAGTRGAQVYSTYDLDTDIAVAESYLNTSIAGVLPSRSLDFYITQANFNLRDQIRQGEYFPLQFAYQAADCRIFYTPQTFYSSQDLWQYAVDAVYSNPSLCVQGSTSLVGPDDPTVTNNVNTKETIAWKPSPANNYSRVYSNAAVTKTVSSTDLISNDNVAAYKLTGEVNDFIYQAKLETLCQVNDDCDPGESCLEVEFCSLGYYSTMNLCKRPCQNAQSCGSAQNHLYCNKKEKYCKGNHPCVLSGWCEAISDPPDSLCRSLKGPPPPSSSSLSEGVIIVPPTLPEDGETEDSVDRTKDDFVGHGTMGGTISAGMAPWA
ncbi:hypothetical protein MMC17_004148 [Xylographa soralifera]|nr:hypothetical protein [Xylographa soralifera]